MRKHAIIDAQATTSTKCSPEIQVKHEMTCSRSTVSYTHLTLDLYLWCAFGGCGRLRVDDSMFSHVALASISLTRAFPCCAALVLAALSLSFTHFSCAVRTTVIMAADRREARCELGTTLCVTQAGAVDFAHLLRFPTDLLQPACACWRFHYGRTMSCSRSGGATLGR